MVLVSEKNKNILFLFREHHFGAVNFSGKNVAWDFYDFFDKQPENGQCENQDKRKDFVMFHEGKEILPDIGVQICNIHVQSFIIALI